MQENEKRNTHYWDSRRKRIKSSKGKWSAGDDVNIGGYSLKLDLLGHVSYMQVVILNATGRLIERKLADWFEGNFISMSYPDSRIWCNQVGAFAGQAKTSVLAGTVAGVLSSDSRILGVQTNVSSMKLIVKALKLHQQKSCIREIVEQLAMIKNGKPSMMGYARPIAKADERIEPHERMRKALGFRVGPHLALAFEIGQFLQQHYQLGLNISGYVAAFLCDQGFTENEVYRIKATSVASGVTAAYIDGVSEPIYAYLPLKCSDTNYAGPAKRKLN